MPGAQTASDSQANQLFSEIKMELYYTYTYMIIYVQYVYKYAAHRYTYMIMCVG